ncbi:unnamed protein product [Gulo gulo]|uniref:Uncharacterized protein n=1 Tax=Gulo gulo TaxID=48420 RepID=A0A9X9LXI8_GULGU|nr:unnamed protein product [Gulo gulo]
MLIKQEWTIALRLTKNEDAVYTRVEMREHIKLGE